MRVADEFRIFFYQREIRHCHPKKISTLASLVGLSSDVCQSIPPECFVCSLGRLAAVPWNIAPGFLSAQLP